ncbi:secretion and acid tolerance protein [Streptococcus gallolyticus]|uniref:Secretion and acid tolerance protein n=1 Tax=Streptococcus gallolyticus TaxID=315405 RepID=A0A380K9J8_9STRE|nr:secretion and acid tolerance protein [Streptococcus gallolyticus]
MLILLSHFIIDFGKPHVANSFKLNPLITFLLDQMLHLGIILLLAPLAKGALLPNFLTEEALNIILIYRLDYKTN